MKGHYQKVKPLNFPEPKATVQYDQPAGPAKPKTTGETAREMIGGFFRQGLQNFAENARRSREQPDPRESFAERVQRPGRRAGRQPRVQEPMFNIPRQPGLEIDFGGHQGLDIDLSMHPDPMYSGRAPGKHKKEHGPRRTVKTVTYYED